jgi:glycogen operon protein
MTAEHWQDPLARAVIAYIDGSRDPDRDARGRPLLGDDLLVLVNGYWEPLYFTLPPIDAGWRLALDTADPAAAEAPVPPGMPVTVRARSLLLLGGRASAEWSCSDQAPAGQAGTKGFGDSTEDR